MTGSSTSTDAGDPDHADEEGRKLSRCACAARRKSSGIVSAGVVVVVVDVVCVPDALIKGVDSFACACA